MLTGVRHGCRRKWPDPHARTPSFDGVRVGDELAVHHTRLSRGDPVNYAGVAGDADIEFSGRVKSLDPVTRSGVVVAAKSDGKKIFGLATLHVRFR